MRYSDWTDREWNELLELCHRDGILLYPDEIREVAFSYMRHGADGGGNKHGLIGTVVALNVDKVGASP